MIKKSGTIRFRFFLFLCLKSSPGGVWRTLLGYAMGKYMDILPVESLFVIGLNRKEIL